MNVWLHKLVIGIGRLRRRLVPVSPGRQATRFRRNYRDRNGRSHRRTPRVFRQGCIEDCCVAFPIDAWRPLVATNEAARTIDLGQHHTG